MRSVLFVISLILLSLTTNSSAEVVATFETEYGHPAYVVTSNPIEYTPLKISFYNLRLDIAGQLHRIAESSAPFLLSKICRDFRPDYPYSHSRGEARYGGLLGLGAELAAEITDKGIVKFSDETVVLTDGFCQSSDF